MHIYDESTSRTVRWRAQINWSRERTFSERQVNYIRKHVPCARGVYCIYAKYHVFDYPAPELGRKRWSRVIYVGSGLLRDRLSAHLAYKRNPVIAALSERYELAYRYDRVVESEILDWPKTVEACLLLTFEDRFGRLPHANRSREAIPELPIDRFFVQQSANFDYLARG